MVRRSTAARVLAPALLAVAACSSQDGRTLPEPDPSLTTTSPPVATADTSGAVTAGPAEALSLYSPDFADGDVLPARFTCDGEATSPALEWSPAPAGSQLALVVRDRTAGDAVHWVVTGIDPSTLGVGAGGIPEGAVEATSFDGRIGWSAPCPVPGTGEHSYEITLHVLTAPLDLPPAMDGADAAAAVEDASAERAALTATVDAG